jgi:hypothetical protein
MRPWRPVRVVRSCVLQRGHVGLFLLARVAATRRWDDRMHAGSCRERRTQGDDDGVRR